MGSGHLIVAVFSDRDSLVLVIQIVIDFLQQVFFTFIIHKVYPRGKVFKKVFLIITQQKTAAPMISKARRGMPLLMLRREIFRLIRLFLKTRGISA